MNHGTMLPGKDHRSEADPLRVVHVISGLELGGAETALFNLVGALRGSTRSEVVSMTTRGVLGERIAGMGIPVAALGMRRDFPSPWGLVALTRRLRASGVGVVQTWMYHADLFGGAAARLAGVPVVWGIHHTTLEPGSARPRTRALARLNALLSRSIPARIVACGAAVQRVHAGLGFDARRMTVIPNGFDVERFRPDSPARAEVRAELGIPREAPLIGMVARFHPQKDHSTFLRAAGRLRGKLPEVRFVLCGAGIAWDNSQLAGWIDENGLRPAIHLLGTGSDLARVYPAMDVLCLSSSHGEGFPMVLGEAMACGVPCVATDVGDAAAIVGDTGVTVAPGDPERLAAALLQIAEMAPEARRSLGESARRRIDRNFRVEIMAERYLSLYLEITRARRIHAKGLSA